jgi:hypothetical protein
MEKLHELRDSLMEAKLKGFHRFETHKSGKWFLIDDLINEIDNLRVCQCPPKTDLS